MKVKTIRELVSEKYSLNHLIASKVEAPRAIYDDAIVKVTLIYDDGEINIELPVSYETINNS